LRKSDVFSQFEWLVPSVPVLVFGLTLWMSLLFMPQMLNGDGDIGRHLTIGKWILDNQQIPLTDVFSDTLPGKELIPHEWLSQVLFALAYRFAGLTGVAWLTAIILASTYAILTASLKHWGVRAFIAGASGIAAFVVGAIHQLTRPHIFTLLFFTLFVIALENYRREGNWRALILLPGAMIVWANLHGAFVTGIVLVGFYAIGSLLDKNYRRAGELSVLAFALVIAACFNPVGAQLIAHSFDYPQNRFLVDVTNEYQSPNFHGASAMPFAALIALALMLGWRAQQRLSWSALIPQIGWLMFALYSARNIPLAAQISLATLAPVADHWLTNLTPRVNRFLDNTDFLDRRSSGWIWAAVIVVVLVGLQMNGVNLDLWNKGNVFDARRFPVAAVNQLQTSPPAGAMFNEFTWGGYLLYRLYPTQRVFIDGQTDFYGEALTREYLQIVDGEPGWESKLDSHNVRWIIIPPGRPLARWLNQSPAWSRVFLDETAGVWVKR
jgi:hypothetical protein